MLPDTKLFSNSKMLVFFYNFDVSDDSSLCIKKKKLYIKTNQAFFNKLFLHILILNGYY